MAVIVKQGRRAAGNRTRAVRSTYDKDVLCLSTGSHFSPNGWQAVGSPPPCEGGRVSPTQAQLLAPNNRSKPKAREGHRPATPKASARKRTMNRGRLSGHGRRFAGGPNEVLTLDTCAGGHGHPPGPTMPSPTDPALASPLRAVATQTTPKAEPSLAGSGCRTTAVRSRFIDGPRKWRPSGEPHTASTIHKQAQQHRSEAPAQKPAGRKQLWRHPPKRKRPPRSQLRWRSSAW